MKMVYLLWASADAQMWVEGVYADKDKAEADMRALKEQDKAGSRVYHYSVQEKEVI